MIRHCVHELNHVFVSVVPVFRYKKTETFHPFNISYFSSAFGNRNECLSQVRSEKPGSYQEEEEECINVFIDQVKLIIICIGYVFCYS